MQRALERSTKKSDVIDNVGWEYFGIRDYQRLHLLFTS